MANIGKKNHVSEKATRILKLLNFSLNLILNFDLSKSYPGLVKPSQKVKNLLFRIFVSFSIT